MKIVVDAMGGDNAPQAIVKGALLALEQDKSLEVVLVGKKDEVLSCLSGEQYDQNRLSVVNADSVITNDDSPAFAIKTMRDSSLCVSYDLLLNDPDCMGLVSAGSTGAVLVGATLKLRRLEGVLRPALAPILPTLKTEGVVLCDCGANVDCKPEYLLHFAIMGSAYATAMLKVSSPRVGLLNNGVEQHKGNELAKQAYDLLAADKNINFVGNCEARDILSGDFDVVVCDGFNGNIALKSAEGTANAVIQLLKEGVYSGGLRTKVGGFLLKPVFKSVSKRLDYNSNGGACFLGVKKVVVKSHGASKPKSVCASILQAKALVDADICKKIDEAISSCGTTAH